MTREQIEASDIDTLAKLIDESLFFNTFDWQRKTGNLYIGKNLDHGLENMLYLFKGIEAVGRGHWSASRKGYTYQGTFQGETVKLFFPAFATRYFPFDPGHEGRTISA